MAQGELLRAEIEKQKDYYDKKEMEAWNIEDALFYQGKRKMCTTLLAFIDSLPEEKHSEGLDFQTFASEISNVFALPKERTTNTKENPMNWEYEIARHFYELGKKRK